MVGAREIALMRATSRLINTLRGPIVDEASLVKALQSRKIAGATLDVFDRKPLPPDHPFRHLDDVLPTPHIGYVGESLYRTLYGDVAAAVSAWLDAQLNHASPVE